MPFLLGPLSIFFFPPHLLLYLFAFASWLGPFQAISAFRAQLSYCTAAAAKAAEGEQERPSRAINAWQLRMQRFVPARGKLSQRCSPLSAQAQGPPKAVSEDLSSVQISPADCSWQHTFVQFLEGKNKASKQGLFSMKWCSRSKEKFLFVSDTCNISKQCYLFYFL